MPRIVLKLPDIPHADRKRLNHHLIIQKRDASSITAVDPRTSAVPLCTSPQFPTAFINTALVPLSFHVDDHVVVHHGLAAEAGRLVKHAATPAQH